MTYKTNNFRSVRRYFLSLTNQVSHSFMRYTRSHSFSLDVSVAATPLFHIQIQFTLTQHYWRGSRSFLANVNYVTYAICYRNSVCRLSVCLWRWCTLLSRL